MNKSAKTWLVFMMVPFFVGVLVHFLVPLEIIITANPKLEQAYNGYKIEVEQNTVRALAFLNARVITNRLQMYQNIRSTFIRLYEREDMYQTMNVTEVQLVSAYELANGNTTSHNVSNSMWYSPNFTSYAQMDNTSLAIYNSYAQVQPFIESIYGSSDQIYQGLLDLQVILDYQDYQFDFQYPARVDTNFVSPDFDILDNYYAKTLSSYQQDGFLMTTFLINNTMRMCTVLILQNDTQTSTNGSVTVTPRGVVCIGLDISTVIKDITSVLGVPQFQLSTNEYYLVRPIYTFENLTYPKIIANFSSSNLSLINIPSNATFSLKENPLPRKIFISNGIEYTMNIQRHERTKTYYTIPIVNNNYDDSTQTAFFLVVLNNFAKAQLAQQSRNQRIAIIMIVPSVLLLLISIIVTTIILRSILRKLDNALGLMGEYCALIKMGDLKLQIPQYSETEDLKQLFLQLQKLNQLNKYADISYFNVPKPERIIRFLKCIKLFDQLGYDKTNLYENIGECYHSIGENDSAIKYMSMSIEMTIRTTYGDQKQIERIYEDKLNKKWSKLDKASRKKDKVIKRKILRICYFYYLVLVNNNTEARQKLGQKAQLLRKIIYPDILNIEYICCLFFIVSSKLTCGDFSDMQSRMQILYDLIKGYQQINEDNQNCESPPDVLYSYWYSTSGVLKMIQKKYVQAYQLFVKALQGNKYNPDVHQMVNTRLGEILEIHGLNKQEMNSFKYIQQYKERTDREYIFLMDAGKPDMGNHQVNQWKKRARKMADHIFTKLVKANDRVSITQFCLDIKIVCNLIQKGNREKMLRKQLMNSIKARDQSINALIIPCLRKSIERARNLKKQKVFLIFLKGNNIVDGDQIMKQIVDIDNSKFIFFTENPEQIQNKSQNFYVINYENELDVNRILEQKIWKQADNIVYIL